VIVAILDSGVDGTHEDLAAILVPGWNFFNSNSDSSDVYGHGTAVAGTVAAITNNGNGVASVAAAARSCRSGFREPMAMPTIRRWRAPDLGGRSRRPRREFELYGDQCGTSAARPAISRTRGVVTSSAGTIRAAVGRR